MGQKATFDSDSRVISITSAPVNGVVVFDVQVDLYSDGKEDWLTDPILNKSIFPVDVIGNQDIGGANAPIYYFLRNDLGWRIKPFEGDHTFQIIGNLVGFDPNTPIFTPTVGGFSVLLDRIANQVPSQSGSSDSDKVLDIWSSLGLDVSDPVTHTQNSISNNRINQDLTGDGVTSKTVTRTP